jgi:hypothetical protein
MPGTRIASDSLAEDFSAARAVIPNLADRASELFARIREPGIASPLPGWTAGDVAVHLAVASTAYAAAATGDLSMLDGLGAPEDGTASADAIEESPSPTFQARMAALPTDAPLTDRVAALNARTLARLTAVPDAHRATPARLRAAAEAIVAATAAPRDPSEPCPVPWFGDDVHLPLSTVVGLFLSETLLHSLDAARASRQRWPVPPGTARLIISLVFPEMMPRTVHQDRAGDLRALVHLHVRGGVTIGLDIDGGKVRTVRDPVSRRADCHISVDPVGFLLAASGRASQRRQIAAGRMIPYGRRPWLAPQVSRLFGFP